MDISLSKTFGESLRAFKIVYFSKLFSQEECGKVYETAKHGEICDTKCGNDILLSVFQHFKKVICKFLKFPTMQKVEISQHIEMCTFTNISLTLCCQQGNAPKPG